MIIAGLSIFSALLTIILFLVFCTKKSGRDLWVIFIYCLLSFIIDFIQARTKWGTAHKYEIMSVLTIVEYSLIAYFFYLAIFGKLVRKLITLFSILVVIFLIFTFLRSDKKSFDSISASIESITIIILSIVYFFEQISKSQPQDHFIYSSPNFWIVLALMMYMSGDLFLFLMAGSVDQKYWTINNVINFITNIIFSIAFLVSRFVPQKISPEKTSFV